MQYAAIGIVTIGAWVQGRSQNFGVRGAVSVGSALSFKQGIPSRSGAPPPHKIFNPWTYLSWML